MKISEFPFRELLASPRLEEAIKESIDRLSDPDHPASFNLVIGIVAGAMVFLEEEIEKLLQKEEVHS